MFGYVKPVVSELLVREHEFYRATYCGVCRAMKRHTGALSNVSLSYDSVLLALLRMNFIPKGEIKAERRRCIVHPMKRRGMLAENSAIEYTARAFALFTYYKLRDDLADGSLAKRIAVMCAKPISAGAKRRAGITDLADVMEKKLNQITELEKKRTPSTDEPAGVFGELLGEVFAYGLEGADRTVYYAFGNHLGRFIYAADAAEDYERDYKSGNYNPYVAAYGTPTLTTENKQTIKCALLLECHMLEGALNLMPFGNRATIENIARNIIYLGLPKRIEFLGELPDEKEIEN